MNYRLKRIIQTAIDTVLVFAIFGGAALGIEIDYRFFIMTIVAIPLLIISLKFKKIRLMKANKEKIKEQWGKEHIEKRDFVHIEKLYKYLSEEEKTNFSIDNITWRDLNMDSVFSKIDHTMSLPGMQYLYDMLRKLMLNGDILKKRNERINSFLEKKNISQEIQYLLLLLGKKEGKGIFKYFKNGVNIKIHLFPIYVFLSYLPYLVLGLFLINPAFAVISLPVVMMLNMLAYQLNKKKVYEEMDTFRYLGGLIKTAEDIMKLDLSTIDLDQDEIRDLLKKVKPLRRNLAKINFNEKFGSEAELMISYYNMIVLKEPKAFYRLVRLINKYKIEFFKIYTLIGKIDAYISVASYKAGVDYFTEPNFIEDNLKFYLETGDIYHPLLENPISYSIEFDNKGALVTGSNASGKSTFLRTIGINSIFAQTLNLVLAKSYKSSYFKLLTSIGTTDSIVHGDSYFMAEAKSLKRIIDILHPEQPVLCILDEIFRGTNTAERISAARESLNYMIERNCCVLAATHDLELTNLVNDGFNNYHFKETIETNDIKFDYILREGPCSTRNAIAILKYLGYPVEIYENATRRAEEYLEEAN
ncbi:MutS-related protein [Tissierella sp.]|uniref:MutS-related protein n=1 Tax=Tissierella sp. TaxID=41274 RepID=UPI00285CD020|nr:hypothetical protein [Tissierella sp.]MDR7856622.1 hypothetical protein [Tissierella sp.]